MMTTLHKHKKEIEDLTYKLNHYRLNATPESDDLLKLQIAMNEAEVKYWEYKVQLSKKDFETEYHKL